MIDLEKMAEQHKQLFPNATAESQFYKMEEEIEELSKTKSREEHIKETADVYIVCAGLYRWFPRTAISIYLNYYQSQMPLCIEEEVEAEVNRKWQINLKRKWAWNGKTYHHVGDDEC